MDIINLNSFLEFGYFLDYKFPDYSVDFSRTDKLKYKNVDEELLIDTGISLWNNAIDKQFVHNEKHVIPLSGGLDSRAILGSLLKYTDAKNIHTYTFGTPGTFDFDIGNKIAKIIGTNHTNFPLTKYNYSIDDLIGISGRVDHQTLLFLHPPVSMIDNLFSDFNVWSGTIIDVFFGRHNHLKRANNLKDGILNSFSENKYVESIDLTKNGEYDYSKYISFNEAAAKTHAYEHIIDLLNRQLKFIAPHVLMKGYNYKTLLDDDLTDFALSIDEKLLDNQYLYKKIFVKEFPYLFSLPNKTSQGLSLNPSVINKFSNILIKGVNSYKRRLSINYTDPNLNYIDFNHGIRHRKDLNTIIYSSIMDLKERKIIDWIDIDNIWKRHINKESDHADALITLASLEIHLKAGKSL